MPRTVTIEVPDRLGALMDKVISRWEGKGKSPEETLVHVLHHGLEMMDIPEQPGPEDYPAADHVRLDGDDLPF